MTTEPMKIQRDREEIAYDAAATVVMEEGEGGDIAAQTLERAVHAALVAYELSLGADSRG